jgi:putative AdoMet-dependent methyltransferase
MDADDPFSPDEFDPWAESYDHDVASQDRFPFAGYEQALDTVVEQAAPQAGMSVLDIGTGTGNLALRFAERGCDLWCTDFSEAMLSKAREKLPQAHFVLHDLRQPWPAALDRRFDRIVSAYVFHHFDLAGKVGLCKTLVTGHLTPGGTLIVADLSFPDDKAMAAFAQSVGELWEQEPYWLADEALPALMDAGMSVSYTQVSGCAGVYKISAK